jgi:hypothetical protein
MQPVYEDHKFEALKVHYESHVSLLRQLTNTDLTVFTTYITLQIAFGGWLSKNPVQGAGLQVGIFLIDLTLSGITGVLLWNNYLRRKEVVAILKNFSEALGFDAPDIYLPGKAVNVPTTFRPWWYWYLIAIIAGAVGIALIIFASSPSP